MSLQETVPGVRADASAGPSGHRVLRVLHVTPSYFPAFIYGGPIHSVHHLCLGLARLGHQVRVLTTDANGLSQRLDLKGEDTVSYEPGLKVRYCSRFIRHSVSPRLLLTLRSEVAWADVVHLTAVFSFPTIPTLIAASLLGKPVIWSPRGALQRWEGSRRTGLKAAWETVCKVVASQPVVFHATSEAEQRSCLLRFPSFDSVVIPNGVEIPLSIAKPGSDTSLRMLFIGRLDPKKGLENLLGACALLRDRGPAFSLQIAGSGPPPYVEQLRKIVRERHLESNVVFLGPVVGSAKTALFEQSDLLVCPSHTENFGLVVAEALASGVPVVAGVGTPWSRILDKQCGLWVPNDAESLATAIRRIWRMPLADMGRRGREWMTNEFSWEPIALRMENVYRSVAHGA